MIRRVAVGGVVAETVQVVVVGYCGGNDNKKLVRMRFLGLCPTFGTFPHPQQTNFPYQVEQTTLSSLSSVFIPRVTQENVSRSGALSVKKCTERPYRGFVSPASSLANFLSPDSMNESNEKKKSNSSLSRIVASDDFLLTFSGAFRVSAADKREINFA